MADKQASTEGSDSSRPTEITVEYIKENDFTPLRDKKYTPRTVYKVHQRSSGRGYVTKTSGTMVRVIAATANQGQDKSPRRTRRHVKTAVGSPLAQGGSARADQVDLPDGYKEETSIETTHKLLASLSTPEVGTETKSVVEDAISSLVDMFGEEREEGGLSRRASRAQGRASKGEGGTKRKAEVASKKKGGGRPQKKRVTEGAVAETGSGKSEIKPIDGSVTEGGSERARRSRSSTPVSRDGSVTRGTGRGSRASTPVSLPDTDMPTETKAKKGRARSRTPVSVEGSERGRRSRSTTPVSVQSGPSISPTPEGAVTTGKRKRGRPPKRRYTEEDGADIQSNVSEGAHSMEGGDRGQGEVGGSRETSPGDGELPRKKKRGRPPKRKRKGRMPQRVIETESESMRLETDEVQIDQSELLQGETDTSLSQMSESVIQILPQKYIGSQKLTLRPPGLKGVTEPEQGQSEPSIGLETKGSILDLESDALDLSLPCSTSTPQPNKRKPGSHRKGKITDKLPQVCTPEGIPMINHMPCPYCGRVFAKRFILTHLKKCSMAPEGSDGTGLEGGDGSLLLSTSAVLDPDTSMDNIHNPLADWSVLQDQNISDTSLDASARCSRSAAAKARNNIQTFIRKMGPEASASAGTAVQEATPKRGKKAPGKYRLVEARLKPVTKYFKQKWQKDIDALKEVSCPYTMCKEVFECLEGIVAHYPVCEFRPQYMPYYECSRCKDRSATEEEAINHAAKHNWDVKPEEDIEFKVEAEAAAAAESDNKDSDWDESELEKTPKKKKRNFKVGRAVRSASIQRRHSGAGAQERLELVHTLSWTLNWRANHQQTDMTLFNNWRTQAKDWRRLDDSESEKILPQSEFSPWFCRKILEDQKGETKSEAKYLPRFGSTTDDINILYAGGPVRSMAWLPRRDGIMSNQYLAIYANRLYDKHHSIMKASPSPAAIQLWAFGTMTDGTLAKAPKLSLVLVEPDGPVWDMKWCPRRSYDADDSHLPLLGFLAVATSSGKIKIYSIPKPSSLGVGKSAKLSVFSVDPALTLVPYTATMDSKLEVCLCLDWQYLDGSTRIFAGYVDGIVAIYDIGTTSPLLRVETKDGLRIHPAMTFNAQHGAITTVSVNQRRPQFFTTTSQDRSMKVWNTEYLHLPVNVLGKSEFTTACWPLHWPVTMGGCDNCYSLEHNAVYLFDAGYFGLQNRPLTVHNACINDLSFSDWLNTLVSVDSAGTVEGMFLPFLLSVHKNHKSFTSRRMVLYRLDCEPLEPCRCETPLHDVCDVTSAVCSRCRHPLMDAPQNKETATPSKARPETAESHSNSFLSSVQKVMEKMDSVTTEVRPASVQEMMELYTLVFSDANMENLDLRKGTKISTAKDLKPDLLWPLLSSQNKVEWNPNLGSHLWQAVGGESGLVRLIHLPLFSNQRECDFVAWAFNQTGCPQEDDVDDLTS